MSILERTKSLEGSLPNNVILYSKMLSGATIQISKEDHNKLIEQGKEYILLDGHIVCTFGYDANNNNQCVLKVIKDDSAREILASQPKNTSSN